MGDVGCASCTLAKRERCEHFLFLGTPSIADEIVYLVAGNQDENIPYGLIQFNFFQVAEKYCISTFYIWVRDGIISKNGEISLE
jgi:hypothetical protein